jgi:predicted DNA-binding mobile mystery protein A
MSGLDFLTLQRRQLDKQLGPKALLRRIKRPPRGWIRTIRESLGMSTRQLARRLRVTQQAIPQLEKSELSGAITLVSLRKVANALDCDVIVAFVPRTSLEATVERQALAKAREMRRRIAHTMALEAQSPGAEEGVVGSEAADVEQWRTTFLKRLWDREPT